MRLENQQPKVSFAQQLWRSLFIAIQAENDVLNGVVVFFEGYTDDVSVLRLTKLIYKNGGKVRYEKRFKCLI